MCLQIDFRLRARVCVYVVVLGNVEAALVLTFMARACTSCFFTCFLLQSSSLHQCFPSYLHVNVVLCFYCGVRACMCRSYPIHPPSR